MAADLTPQKARVLLMLALAAGERGLALREHFEDQSGEGDIV
jgi:L-asparaginase/Glu-tRNA(Gln) amidotransferase subunit D